MLWAGDAAARNSGAAGRLLGCGLGGSRDLLCTLPLLGAAAAAMELESPRCRFCFLKLRFCIALLALLGGEGTSAAARRLHKAARTAAQEGSLLRAMKASLLLQHVCARDLCFADDAARRWTDHPSQMAAVDFAALLLLDELVAAGAARTLCWFAGVLRDL